MKFVSNEHVDKVIKRLKSKKEFEESDFIKLNNELSIIDIQESKIKYGYLSKCIRSMDKEVRDNIYSNAENCMDFSVEEENDILVQIINHIILEVPRANDFEALYEQSERYNNRLREYGREQKDFSYKMEKFENIKSEFIGILSIFSAVVIGFFGGLNAIGSAFSNMDNVSKYRIVFIIIVLGLIMFNVIYMLLREVSKLAGKENEKDIKRCNACKNNKQQHLIKCVMTKHPYAYYFNLISIIGLVGIYGLYLIDKYNMISALLKLWKDTKINIAFIPIIGVAVASLAFIIIFFVFINPNMNKYNCNTDYKSKRDIKKTKQDLKITDITA